MQVNRKDLKCVLLELLADKTFRVFWEHRTSQPRLDGDLPGARDAKEDLICSVRDQSSCPTRKFLAVRHPPDERVRVQENPHSKCFWSSFGSGASKSRVMLIFPRAVPGFRRPT